MTRGVGVPRQVMGGVQAQPAKPLDTVLLAMDAGLTDDHLVCRATDSDPINYVPILVAKPWLLRKKRWDGQTRDQVRYVYDLADSTKRTAYDINDPPDTPEAERNKRTELISPRYVLGDELHAAIVNTGIIVGDTPLMLVDATGNRDWTVFFEQL